MITKLIGRKSQVTIFIIIAIVIFALLIIVFYPRIQKTFFIAKTPQEYLQNCLQSDIDIAVSKLKSQGGSINPENYYLYKDNKLEYLCYTNEYYKTCVMQQPLLKQHFENELAGSIKDRADECMSSLIEDYRNRGYEVERSGAGVSAELVPGNIQIIINSGISIKKDTAESYDKLILNQKSGIYDLIMIAASILNYEASLGDSAPESFMYYYPDLKVEKLKQGDGSKIYIVSNRETKESFMFATRSLSWPAGYNVNQEVVK